MSALLPLFLFSITLLTYIGLERTNSIENSIKSASRALTSSVDEQIIAIQSTLHILSTIEDFDEKNLKSLHAKLTQFVKDQDGWNSIALVTRDGKTLFNTIRDFGKNVPAWGNEPLFHKVIKSRGMEVSNYRLGRLTGKKVFSVAVPVIVKTDLKYVLIATFDTDFLSKNLRDQEFPTSWTAAILDEYGIIIARSRDNEKFSGTEATPVLRQKVSSYQNAIFEDFNKEGIPSYGAFHRTKDAPWTVVLGIPQDEVKLPYVNLIMIFMLGGGILIGLGILLTVKFSRNIAAAVTNLSSAARAFGKGEKPEPYNFKLLEIKEVYAEIIKAAADREKLDEANAELLKKAQEAVEVRDTFLSVASHELKTPLTSISLQTQILKRIADRKEEITSEKFNYSIHRMINQLNRLAQLINDLLDVSRIQAGHLKVRPENIDLFELLKDVLDPFQNEHKNIPITLKGQPTTVFHDGNRLEQVFTNLVSNAIKYGNAQPIIVTLTSDETHATVEVKDHGWGLKAEEISRIFERFERVGNRPEISGMGLGLWIVKKILDESGGSISVESDGPQQGSKFIVKLPLIGKES